MKLNQIFIRKQPLMSLSSILESHSGRIVHKIQHYIPIYESYFEVFRGKSPKVLEIGVGKGGSLQVWRKYFGEDATIVGLDIREKCLDYVEDGISVVIGDQTNPEIIKETVAKYGPFDVVIDDGSHMMSHISSTFELLYKTLPPDGVYLIEDLCCSYWSEFEGGLRKETTFVEIAKRLVDELNKEHWRESALQNPWLPETHSISFHDSIVVFKRGYPHKFKSKKFGVS